MSDKERMTDNEIIKALERMSEEDPDVVKVVRCKDCKYSRKLQTKSEKTMYCSGCVICTNGEISDTEFAMWDDDFCNYGERKDKIDK